MNKIIGTILLSISLLALLVGNRGCEPRTQISNSGATQVGAGQTIPKNSEGLTMEQQNIIDRLRVTMDPSKVMWIHLIALDGNIIRRMPVRNKVTSSGKRLEPKIASGTSIMSGPTFPDSGIKIPGSENSNYETTELIQSDGTFGESDPYIFWFDPLGRYHQYGTAGSIGYLLTDYPIDIEDPVDMITGLYNIQQQAAEWQATQEKALRQGQLQ